MQTSKLKTLQVELTKLAGAIEEQWRNSNYELKVFPEICSEHLKKHSLEEVPSLETVLAEITDIELPMQNFANGEFSDFSVTMARSDKLLIDLYYWYRSDTSIHNHHFCGAFKVIAGESYQVKYSFNKIQNICEGFDKGVMKEMGNDHLSVGAVHPIDLYDNFIHHIFHLGKPTVTLCVRTPVLPGEGLATFVYPKYRMVLSPLNPNQQKWLQALRVHLEQTPQIRPNIPWSDAEMVHILFRSSAGHVMLSPEVSAFLQKHLEERAFMPDFFELTKKQAKFNEKLKKFGLVTGPLKEKID